MLLVVLQFACCGFFLFLICLTQEAGSHVRSFVETVGKVESYLWHKAQGKEVKPFTFFNGEIDYGGYHQLPESPYNQTFCPL